VIGTLESLKALIEVGTAVQIISWLITSLWKCLRAAGDYFKRVDHLFESVKTKLAARSLDDLWFYAEYVVTNRLCKLYYICRTIGVRQMFQALHDNQRESRCATFNCRERRGRGRISVLGPIRYSRRFVDDPVLVQMLLNESPCV